MIGRGVSDSEARRTVDVNRRTVKPSATWESVHRPAVVSARLRDDDPLSTPDTDFRAANSEPTLLSPGPLDRESYRAGLQRLGW